MWLWPNLMQRELDKFCHFANNRRVRKQLDKSLPSGTTPNFAYKFPGQYGGHDCLQPVDVAVINEMLEDLEEEKRVLSDWGVDPEFAELAEAACAELHIHVEKLTMETIWLSFSAILSIVSRQLNI